MQVWGCKFLLDPCVYTLSIYYLMPALLWTYLIRNHWILFLFQIWNLFSPKTGSIPGPGRVRVTFPTGSPGHRVRGATGSLGTGSGKSDPVPSLDQRISWHNLLTKVIGKRSSHVFQLPNVFNIPNLWIGMWVEIWFMVWGSVHGMPGPSGLQLLLFVTCLHVINNTTQHS
jgi:hypothetical protein